MDGNNAKIFSWKKRKNQEKLKNVKTHSIAIKVLQRDVSQNFLTGGRLSISKCPTFLAFNYTSDNHCGIVRRDIVEPIVSFSNRIILFKRLSVGIRQLWLNWWQQTMKLVAVAKNSVKKQIEDTEDRRWVEPKLDSFPTPCLPQL